MRYSTHATAGTATSAAHVSAVCDASTGIGIADSSGNGLIVGGVVTLGNVTRYA